jgi:hypothetical protein
MAELLPKARDGLVEREVGERNLSVPLDAFYKG